MRASLAFCILILGASAIYLPAAVASQQNATSPSLGKIKQASSAAIDCSACPRALAEAGTTAREELLSWKRFRIVDDPKQADLVFLFSANPYLGDYLTRQGPDTRPVRIASTIMTVIDPRTGKELWSDSRRWGSWRVAGATRSLIGELRSEMESEARRWTVDDILSCSNTPAYRPFAYLTPEAALAKTDSGVSRMTDAPDRLRVSSPSAPDFCRRAQLVVDAHNQINSFEVVASESDTLDVADILEQADRFNFSSGKDPQTQQVYFMAESKNKKVLIQFDVQGHRTILSRVSYFY